MRNLILPLLLIVVISSCQSDIPATGFSEPEFSRPVDEGAWNDVGGGLNVAFGSVDHRFEHYTPPPETNGNEWTGTAWRGERVYAQIVLWSSENLRDITISASELKGEGGFVIESGNVTINPVRYVLTDEFLNGCGRRDHDTIPAHLAADLLEGNQEFNLIGKTLRPVWITIDVPAGAGPVSYSGNINISFRGGRSASLGLQLTVQDVLLPEPARWSYHLDLWQNPFAVARYYDVEPWSEQHWELLPPYLEMLAGAGQKCITASILHHPWGGQTYDPFDSMIEWTHLGKGEWEYDYSVFDRWVKLAMESGITGQINCYSMVPWGNQVRYYDNDSSDYVTVTLQPGSDGYVKVWKPFLVSFREHLRSMGWLDMTLIAMDERELDEMKRMVALLKEVAPEFKIALAGKYLAEVNDDLYDLSIFIRSRPDSDQIKERVDRGNPTTFYTSCARPEHPNNFTFSPPAELAWLGWHAASAGYTGYLRWAYNSWVEDPLRDSRFRTWPAGDTYQIYPGPRSSIRFERLREGIQDFEKIRILREIADGEMNKEKLEELNMVLSRFTVDEVQNTPASHWLNRGKEIINELSAEIIQN